MPVLVNPETEKPVAFRCNEHASAATAHNLNADGAECGICALMHGANQGADQMLKYVGEIVDKAAMQLEFFAPGAGESFRRQAASIIEGGTPEQEKTN